MEVSQPQLPIRSPARRACDACHKRKIKCDGGVAVPCRHCQQSNLTCTFDAVPQKKGPKGHRAKVISRLREQQQQQQQRRQQQQQQRAALVSSSSSSRLQHDDGVDDGWRCSPGPSAWAPTPGLLTTDVVEACIGFFFENMYPTMPILHRGRLQRQRQDMESSPETYCLIAALCAFMLIQPGMKIFDADAASSEPDAARDETATGRALVDEVLRVRKGFNYVDAPSVACVMTSFFLFGSYFCLDKHPTAWYYMREATTLAEILGMNDESTYHTGDEIDDIRRRRLFWLLFVTERAYALQRHHPLTLGDTIAMPRLDEVPSEQVEISGFIYLVNVYRPFDEVFVGLWNKTRADCTTEWLAQLQARIANALPLTLVCTESQAADLRTSQQWLRAMVWKLSAINGYLPSRSGDRSMTFQYPIEIARDLVGMTSPMSKQAMEVHGIGLIEKFFDVACTLTEVMSCVPLETPSFELGPRDYLNEFLNLISTLRGGQARYVPQLLTKIDDMLSTMAGPIIPPLIYETHEENRIEEVGEDTSISHRSLLPAPPTLSTSSSDLSELSLISSSSSSGGGGGGDESFSMSLAPYTGMLSTTNHPDRAKTRRRGYGQALHPDEVPTNFPLYDDVGGLDLAVKPPLDVFASQFG